MTFHKENSVNQAPGNKYDKWQLKNGTGGKHGQWWKHYHFIRVCVSLELLSWIWNLQLDSGKRPEHVSWHYAGTVLDLNNSTARKKLSLNFTTIAGRLRPSPMYGCCKVSLLGINGCRHLNKPAENWSTNDFSFLSAVQALLGKCRGCGHTEYLNLL